MRHSLHRKGILSLLTLLLSVGIVIAQSSCPELVSQALEAVDTNCNVAGRNEACYGYDQVEASFLTTVADDFFSQPSNITPIADIETIRTAPLNTDTGVWGVAVMNIQADLPNTIPGQSVTFVLLGDVEVENAVAPEDAFVPSDGVEVTVNIAAGANVRSGPGTNYNVLGGLMNGQTVVADGLSQDGAWLRVAYRERPAWLSMSVINDNDPALRELPTLSADLQTPMQAFYLRTGIGQPECAEAPDDILLVQGPQNININITVNGANIQLGSSGALRIIMIDGQPYLEIIVFDGHFTVGGKTITKGQHSVICLGDENSRGLDGENNDLVVTCDPSDPEAIDTSESGENWCILEDVPSDILNYGLDIPCPGETPPPVNTGGGGGSATESQVEGVSCESFTLISPLGPVDSGNHTFTWTEVTGPNISYELVFYNGGQQVNVFPTTSTSYNLNLGAETQTGGAFQWEVRAFSNGQYLCVTYRTQEIARTSDLDPVAGAGFRAHLDCTPLRLPVYTATINYSGGGGNNVTASLMTAAGGPQSQSSSADSGSFSFTGSFMTSITVTTSVGDSVSLGNCP